MAEGGQNSGEDTRGAPLDSPRDPLPSTTTVPRYAALLRGVSPMNCRMPELKAALEKAGFADVRTVISSGNAVFSARAASERTLERKCEEAFEQHLDHRFLTIVRPIGHLQALIDRDPFAAFPLPDGAKRNVTFLRRRPDVPPQLPLRLRGAELLAVEGCEALTYYIPNHVDPAFMVLIEKTFGKEATTRTWETVQRIVKAATT